jgi:CRP-like cAMP-binding protein
LVDEKGQRRADAGSSDVLAPQFDDLDPQCRPRLLQPCSFTAVLPALVFHEVERLDVVKMMRLLILRRFQSRSVLPRIAQAVQHLSLFSGLDAEQVNRLAGVCLLTTFAAGEVIFWAGQEGAVMHVVLQGEVAIARAGSSAPVALVRQAECLGEISLLTGAAHSATATALTAVETPVLGHRELAELIRLRPDIGLHIYRNLAVGLGEKLKRSGFSALDAAPAPGR